MIRSILLAGAALLSVSISSLNAEASGAPWCAVNPWGDGDVPWACKYRSIEECRLVIAGNRGFCNPNPSYVANPQNSGTRGRPRRWVQRPLQNLRRPSL